MHVECEREWEPKPYSAKKAIWCTQYLICVLPARKTNLFHIVFSIDIPLLNCFLQLSPKVQTKELCVYSNPRQQGIGEQISISPSCNELPAEDHHDDIILRHFLGVSNWSRLIAGRQTDSLQDRPKSLTNDRINMGLRSCRHQ